MKYPGLSLAQWLITTLYLGMINTLRISRVSADDIHNFTVHVTCQAQAPQVNVGQYIACVYDGIWWML